MSPEDLFPIRKGDVFVIEATATYDQERPRATVALEGVGGESVFVTPSDITSVVRRAIRVGDLVDGPDGILDGEVQFVLGSQVVVLYNLRLHVIDASNLTRVEPEDDTAGELDPPGVPVHDCF